MGRLLDLANPSLNAMTDEEILMAALTKHNANHILYPPFLLRKSDLPKLQWKKLPFGQASRNKVPKQKGVYAFALEFGGGVLPQSAHILYIGKGCIFQSNVNTYSGRT